MCHQALENCDFVFALGSTILQYLTYPNRNDRDGNESNDINNSQNGCHFQFLLCINGCKHIPSRAHCQS